MLNRLASVSLGLVVILLVGEVCGVELPAVMPQWTGGDLGRVGLAGRFSERSGIFTVNGAGGGLFVAGDGCYFVSSPMQGDFDITVRALGLKNSVANSTLAILARESLEFDARDVYLFLRPNRDYIAASQARLTDDVESVKTLGKETAKFIAKFMVATDNDLRSLRREGHDVIGMVERMINSRSICWLSFQFCWFAIQALHFFSSDRTAENCEFVKSADVIDGHIDARFI